jgi:hypothetical protein
MTTLPAGNNDWSDPMNVRMITGAAIAALAAGAIASPSFAQDPCHQRKHNNGTAGAVIGGLAGAVLGSNVAGHGARTGGTIIGGVAGAAIGNNIGRSSTHCDGRYSYYYNGRYYDHPVYGNNYYNGGYDGRYGSNNGYYSNGYYDNNGYYHRPY